MCGITGFLAGSPSQDDEMILREMTEVLRHRGPDDDGHHVDPEAGVALGFRRLAILDLSETGRQPMVSHSGRYTVVFNGEIYNFRTLRRELEGRGHRFRGTSDTEVLLAAIEEWGLSEALSRCNGMFGLALWDSKNGLLHLARDRMGKKPLYYGWQQGSFLFGSELKALRRHPSFQREIDEEAFAAYLRLGYVPAPLSIYKDVFKLPAGSLLSVRPHAHDEQAAEPVPYWSLADVVERGHTRRFDGSITDAADELDALLLDATKIRLESDVPLGAFLSGGIDSSLVVALMQEASTTAAKTFTIGFKEDEFSEADHARAIADHLGTEHCEMFVTAQDALDVVPHLPHIYDEPFADSSQIPTYLVSALATQHVSVALTGDGGDESFGGYTRYMWGRTLGASLLNVPQVARRRVASSLLEQDPETLERRLIAAQRWLPSGLRQEHFGEKLHKLAEVMGYGSKLEFYKGLLSNWKDPSAVAQRQGAEWQLPDLPPSLANGSFSEQMMYIDSVLYLPDDILVKVDRATMANSLEARAPLLDYRVVEFAAGLPPAYRTSLFRGKKLLRQVLSRRVPESLFDRPKSGFAIPLGQWLRGPLRGWVEDLLEPTNLRLQGYLDPVPLARLWEQHVRGERDWGYQLWNVLMFQAWLAHE